MYPQAPIYTFAQLNFRCVKIIWEKNLRKKAVGIVLEKNKVRKGEKIKTKSSTKCRTHYFACLSLLLDW